MHKLVIADDDEILLRGLSESVDWNALGIRLVAGVDDGAKALAAVEEHQPQILLTDVRMPIIDGMELIGLVKKLNFEVSVVIISAHDEFSYVHRAIKQGAEDYLLKPVNLMDLEAVMKKIVSDYEAKREIAQSLIKIEDLENEKRNNDRARMLSDAILRTRTREDFAQRYAGEQSGHRHGAFSATIVRTEPTNIDRIMAIVRDFRTEWNVLFVMGRIVIVASAAHARSLSDSLDALKQRLSLVLSAGDDSVGPCYENGGIVGNVFDLHESFQEALELDELFFVHGDRCDIYPGDYAEESKANEQEAETVAGRLAEAALLGNRSSLAPLIGAYRASIEQCGRRAWSVFTYSLSIIFAEIESGFGSMGHYLSDIVGSHTELIGRILSLETFPECLEMLKNTLVSVSDHLSSSDDKSSAGLMMKAVRYIEEKYADPELRITDVAEYTGLSQSYFSSVFKDSTGRSFTDYLTAIRIDKAKVLLASTNHRSYEVSYMVGYSNPTYFSSTFKKQTGMTPSAYSKKHR